MLKLRISKSVFDRTSGSLKKHYEPDGDSYTLQVEGEPGIVSTATEVATGWADSLESQRISLQREVERLEGELEAAQRAANLPKRKRSATIVV